jgi:PRTRC genetic system protein E
MTEIIKEQIDTTTTRDLVSDILDNKYQDEAKEYAVECVKARFEIIAIQLTERVELKKAYDLLLAGKDSNQSDSVQAEMEDTLNKMTKACQQLEVQLAQKDARIKVLEDDNALLFKDLGEAKEFITTQDDSQSKLDAVTIDKLQKDNVLLEKALIAAKAVVIYSTEVPNGESSFFRNLFQVIPDILGLKIIINKEGPIGIVSIYPEPKIGDQDFKTALPPMTFKGTPIEMDTEMITLLTQGLVHVSNVTTQIADYEKSVADAKIQSQMEKEKAKEKAKVKAEIPKKPKEVVGPTIFDTPESLEEENNNEDVEPIAESENTIF